MPEFLAVSCMPWRVLLRSALPRSAATVPGSASHHPLRGAAEGKTGRYYRPELDVLRSMAFLMVFTSHIPAIPVTQSATSFLSTIEEAGSAGVCVFFTLSAYLITELLLRELDATGTIHRAAFFVRRILRIWPLYFLAIALSVFGALVYHRWNAPPRFVLPYLLLCGNVATSVFGTYPRNGLLAPLWSISVEEQFYLLWPLLLHWKGRTGIRCAITVILPLAWCMDLLVPYFGGARDPNLWTNSLSQFQYFALGALIALLHHRHSLRLGRVHRIVMLTAALLLLLVAARPLHFLFSVPPEKPFPILAGYLLIDAACILLLLGILDARVPGWAHPLQYLGKISYGMYVYHFTIWIGLTAAATRILHLRLGVILPELYLIVLASTIAISACSYRYFEKPFLRLKERFAFVPSRAA